MIVYIKENSFWARLAAWKLGSSRMAITLGNTIHLHNTSRDQFLKDIRWVCHELAHVHQYKKYGFYSFLFIYLKESFSKGYVNNKLEQEARHAEENIALLNDTTFL